MNKATFFYFFSSFIRVFQSHGISRPWLNENGKMFWMTWFFSWYCHIQTAAHISINISLICLKIAHLSLPIFKIQSICHFKITEFSLNKLANDWHVRQIESCSENHFVFVSLVDCVCECVLFSPSVATAWKLAEPDGWISAKSITSSTVP